MSPVQIDQTVLAQRIVAARELVRPLIIDPASRKPKTTVACSQIPNASSYILAAYDGARPTADYRSWRFATAKRGFRCMYFEIWQPDDATKHMWSLYRAYFSLYRLNRAKRTEDEILAIHCDPLEEPTAPHAIYKQGPHVHVTASNDPLPHAHFALNLGHLSNVLSDAPSLFAALRDAFVMVADEVLALSWTDAA